VNELALFAGAGGGILGGHLLGWRTVCAVEWDAYAVSVLVQRQNDGCLPPFPVWDDVQTFDGRSWRGRVDVISGGFPCQDISAAGKGAGIDGERSGMWGHMARIVGEVQPRFVFVENSPMLVGRGLARVLGDLAALGYDARWGVVGAHHVAAPHKRDRIWIVGRHANRSNERTKREIQKQNTITGGVCKELPNSNSGFLRNKPRGSSRTKGEDQAELANNGSEKFVANSYGSGSRENLKPSELRTERAFQSSGDSGETDQAKGGKKPQRTEKVADSGGKRLQPTEANYKLGGERLGEQSNCRGGGGGQGAAQSWWNIESDLGRELPDGMANRVDINGTSIQEGISRVGKDIPHRIGRLKCIGNGQVPQCAALAWEVLSKDI